MRVTFFMIILFFYKEINAQNKISLFDYKYLIISNTLFNQDSLLLLDGYKLCLRKRENDSFLINKEMSISVNNNNDYDFIYNQNFQKASIQIDSIYHNSIYDCTIKFRIFKHDQKKNSGINILNFGKKNNTDLISELINRIINLYSLFGIIP